MAALWAVHPASTESVTNIIGRSDLLAAMAMLGGFLMYVKSTTGGRVAYRHGWWELGMVTAAGVASKESAVMIVAVIVLYELAWPGRRRWLDLAVRVRGDGDPDCRDAGPARRRDGRVATRGVSFHGQSDCRMRASGRGG